MHGRCRSTLPALSVTRSLRAVVACFCLAATAVAVTAPPFLPPTPAQRRIEALEPELERSPDAAGYAELAMVYARRARESSDTAYYAQAERAVQRSLTLAPDNLAALKAEVWVLLGRHEFAIARERASALNKRAPDDLQVYGFLTDANVELGDYSAAEVAAQWMLDLRPGNVPAFTRVAYLRELFGDVDGALEMMTSAHTLTPETETEDRAWILTQMGHLYLSTGRLSLAEEATNQALQTFPDYHYALAQLGRLRLAQNRPAEAVALLQRWYEAAPHPENLYVLAKALERAKRGADARKAYADFEVAARREMGGHDNANRELIFYYVDHARDPREALRIGEREFTRRQDVYTRDAYAWALAANGQLDEARAQIDAALAVGLQDAEMYYRAGTIARLQGDREAGRRYFERSLRINSYSEHVLQVRAALAAAS